MTVSRRTIYIATTAVALIAVVAIYYAFNPSECGWMPRCPSKLLTGYDCPGCGSQRAFHALLHGDVAGAWRVNPYLFFAVPFFALVVWGSIGSLPGSARLRRLTHHPAVAWGYVIVFFAWWIIRNL